jgi:phosphate transport system substrate-binding protein
MNFHVSFLTRKAPALASVASVLALFSLLAGCSPATQERVIIKGSNTVGEELAPRLIAEYRKDHPALMIDLETQGTGSGFYGLLAGACDIAAASRLMVTNEVAQAKVRGVELKDSVIGSYSVAVVVNARNSLSNLSREQVRDIFTGTIQNWKEIGGADAPIHLYIRDRISGTYLGFRELAMEDKPYPTNQITAFTNYAAIAQAVANDANGIGYASLQLANAPGVKGVSIGSVPPTPASVNEGKYPYSRALHLFTDKSAETPSTRDFIQFVQSRRGQKIVSEMGFVPRL